MICCLFYSMCFSSRDDTLSVIHSNISFALPFSLIIEPLKLFLRDEGSIFNGNVVVMVIWSYRYHFPHKVERKRKV